MNSPPPHLPPTIYWKKGEKSRECHNYKPQPIPRLQEEEKTDKSKQAQIEQTYEKH